MIRDASVTGKLSGVFRKTYEKDDGEEKLFNSEKTLTGLKPMLRDKINDELDYLVKKYEKDYASKFMELFLAVPETKITIVSAHSLKADKIKIDIHVDAKVPEELVECSKIEFSKNNNSFAFANGPKFTITLVDKDYFVMYMITNLKYVKELLGEDIVKKIYTEVYVSRNRRNA